VGWRRPEPNRADCGQLHSAARTLCNLHVVFFIALLLCMICLAAGIVNVRRLSHLFISPRFLFARRVSCFNTCLGKHSVASEFDPPVEQVNNYVLGLLADRCYVFHLDNEFAATKVRPCLFARTSWLSCPGRNELPFHNHPTMPGVIDDAWRYQ
jgi:hypothetical protein